MEQPAHAHRLTQSVILREEYVSKRASKKRARRKKKANHGHKPGQR
ncbi:50S ribosomal protein bL37 [Nocardia sp. NPDC101769]